MENHHNHWFGQYRTLLLAIALFLVLDLGVLVFNIFTSHLIEQNAALINTAGKLRVYSQQLTKSLLTLRQELQTGEPIQSSLAQLGEAHLAFTDALSQLQQVAASRGQVWQTPMNTEGKALLDHLQAYWAPIEEATAPLLNNPLPRVVDVDGAVIKAVGRNVRLMQLADDLTQHLEAQALSRTASLRHIQMGAILLATLNFIFIVFKFIRRLLESDEAADAARKETRAILETVREGLFLIDRDGRIGQQFSSSLPALFKRSVNGGDVFDALLRELLAAEQHEAARDYIELLFNRKVKPALLEELNPLQEVALSEGGARSKGPSHLSFEFSQVLEEGEVLALLVTVSDISRQVQLAQELAVTEARAGSEVEGLLAVLDQEPAQLRRFLNETEERLLRVNRGLQEVKSEPRAYAELINQIFRSVHTIKGEAGALGLVDLSTQAHQFEEALVPLRRHPHLTGDDLIPIAFQVAELRHRLARLATVQERVQHRLGAMPATEQEHPLAGLRRQIEHLALKVAQDLNKKVKVEVALPAGVPQTTATVLRHLREVLPQLIRNAVVHGIEPEQERLQVGKQAEGTVRVELQHGPDGSLTLSVRDDGRGISCTRIRERLLQMGEAPESVAALDEQTLMERLFSPGFSLLETAHEHAGRGVGLDLIKEMALQAGARLRLSTLPNTYTQFTLQFQAGS